MQELNPLHTHTGTGQDGRKLDATRSLDKLGVASSNEIGEVITTTKDNVTLSGGAALEGVVAFNFPNASAAPSIRFVGVSPAGAKKLLGIDLFFVNNNPGANIRFRTITSITNKGGTTETFTSSPFLITTPQPPAAFRVIRLGAENVFNVPEHLLTPGAFIVTSVERQSTDATDTYNQNLIVQYFRLVFSS